MKVNVKNISTPMRLDLYLLTINPSLTRSSSKKLVMNKKVLVNDRFNLPNFKVREGDIIEILENSSVEEDDLKLIKKTRMKLDILYEDTNLIVLNKEAGVVVHPVYKHMNDTLVNGLAYYFDKKKENVKFRAVHRLDKETSGVIVFSKNLKSHESLSNQFEKREVSKVYYAVVIGDFNEYLKNKESIDIVSYIERNGDSLKRKYKSSSNQKGDISITTVKFVKYWSYERLNKKYKDTKFSLLRVEPKTGRTHQIRVHLSESGFPILGDIIYSDSTFKRMMLHAKSIKLKLLDNSVKVFNSGLPKEFH